MLLTVTVAPAGAPAASAPAAAGAIDFPGVEGLVPWDGREGECDASVAAAFDGFGPGAVTGLPAPQDVLYLR